MSRRILSLAAAPVLLAALMLGTGSAEALATTHGSWQLTATVGVPGNMTVAVSDLFPGSATGNPGLAAAGPADAWSAWLCLGPCGTEPASPVEHWNGQNWATVPAIPLTSPAHSIAVTASSSRNAWIFTWDPEGLMRWNGSTWQTLSMPASVVGGGVIDAPAVLAAPMFGRHHAWVFSQPAGYGTATAYASRYNNGHWTQSQLKAWPEAVAAYAPNSIWAFGAVPSGTTATWYLMHWDGHQWLNSKIPSSVFAGKSGPLVPNTRIAVNASSVYLELYHTPRNYLLRYHARRWQRIRMPAGEPTAGPMTSDGHGGVWLFCHGASLAPNICDWNDGKWVVDSLPIPSGDSFGGGIATITVVPGTRQVWATGTLDPSSGGSEGAIWRFAP